jgi:hypothetical protein
MRLVSHNVQPGTGVRRRRNGGSTAFGALYNQRGILATEGTRDDDTTDMMDTDEVYDRNEF